MFVYKHVKKINIYILSFGLKLPDKNYKSDNDIDVPFYFEQSNLPARFLPANPTAKIHPDFLNFIIIMFMLNFIYIK